MLEQDATLLSNFDVGGETGDSLLLGSGDFSDDSFRTVVNVVAVSSQAKGKIFVPMSNTYLDVCFL